MLKSTRLFFFYSFCYEQTCALAVSIYSFGFVCPFCIYFSYPPYDVKIAPTVDKLNFIIVGQGLCSCREKQSIIKPQGNLDISLGLLCFYYCILLALSSAESILAQMFSSPTALSKPDFCITDIGCSFT